MYSKPAGSRRSWERKPFNCATRYSGVCAARLGKFGDTELPLMPWQFEQTWRAKVVASTCGLDTSRERDGFAHPGITAVATPSIARHESLAAATIEGALRMRCLRFNTPSTDR